MPKTLLIRTAGTNCDRETAHAFELAGSEVALLHLEELLQRPETVLDHGIVVFPGGFTYGDDLGAGTIFAQRLRASLLAPLTEHVAGGGLILGICNGFQILVKTGLLPALSDPGKTGDATLTENDSARFEDRWVHLAAESARCAFIEPGDRIFCPVAHEEGKFVTRDEEVLEQLEANDQVVFRYVGPDGGEEPPYPWNPNGSAGAIAGICDPTGRILGMMPHPERHLDPHHHPSWTRGGPAGEGDGLRLFRRAVAAVR
jgi:phosphoribosylformylglycinamidine synthase